MAGFYWPCPKKYFQKKNYKQEILNHLYFGPSFDFWGITLGRFSQCFFKIFCPWSIMVADIFTHHKISEHSEAVVRRCSVKKVFLEISKDSRKNTCARVSFLIKLQASASRCSPANFAKLIRTPFFTEHFWWLLLKIKMLCTLTLFTQDLLNTSLFSKEFLKFKKREENMWRCLH